MRKIYQKPAIEIAGLMALSSILEGSTLEIDKNEGTQNDFEAKELDSYSLW